jgi:hypothetical protein
MRDSIVGSMEVRKRKPHRPFSAELGLRAESSFVEVTAVERAAKNKFHRAYKPCPNDRQADTIHVKDANCAVTSFSFEISLPFFQTYYSGQGDVSIG